MAIRIKDINSGEIFRSGGSDPKLKMPLVRSSPSEPKGGKVMNELEEEIRVLKRQNQEKGSRIVLLEKELEDCRKALAMMAAARDGLEAKESKPKSDDDNEPWVALGIPKSTYYDRKKKGKL